jgi:hypothetical protein
VIFVSTSLYSLAKRLGLEGAAAEFMRQVQAAATELGEPDRPVVFKPAPPAPVFVPAAYTVARCAVLGEVQINVNAGATVIAKARNIAAHAFLESRCDVWVTVDDDVEVSLDALTTMVSQCKAEPSIVVAPCLLRDTLTANISESRVAFDMKAPNGARLQRIESGGFGCVAMSRALFERMDLESKMANRLTPFWDDADGVRRRVLFRDEIDGGKWFTEDTAFFRHVPASVGRYAVRVGETVHNGQRLDLATLEAIVPSGSA